jgi:hypothetical protein
VPAPPLKTEDDAIYRPNLPSFDDDGTGKSGAGGVSLGQRDSELLISFLTVRAVDVACDRMPAMTLSSGHFTA